MQTVNPWRLLPLLAAIFAMNPCRSQDGQIQNGELDRLKAQYNDRKLELEASGSSQILDLSAQYTVALDALIAQKSRSGDLDGVVVLRAEKEALHDPRNLPKLIDADRELERLRATFISSRDKITESVVISVAELNSRYSTGLAQLEAKLTKSGSIEEALVVRSEKQRVEATIVRSSGGRAQIFVEGDFGTLKEGEMIYSNRGYSWSDVPKTFSGWDIQHRPGTNVVKKIEFEVRAPGLVYVMVDKVNVEKLEADGWKGVDKCGSLTPGRDVFIILEKRLAFGKHSIEAMGFLGARLMRKSEN